MAKELKRSRAVCIPFHRYHPHTDEEFHKVYFYNLLERTLPICHEAFDKLYLIDSYWNFTEEEIKQIEQYIPVQIIPKTKDGHHWVQFKDALPKLNEEYVLFLDNDVVFTKKGVMENWFEYAENGANLVTAFDGSGGLRDVVHSAFPPLKEIDATRMGSYYFVADKKVRNIMKKTELGPINYRAGEHMDDLQYITQEGDWSDSFGLLTIKLFAAGMKIGYIYDDRSSIYYSGREVKEGTADLGYYHIRNGNLPVYMLNSMYHDRKSFDHYLEITPQDELLRILAWFEYLTNYRFKDQIEKLLEESGAIMWSQYYTKFKEFHNL